MQILLILSLIHVLEAWLEQVVIELKNTNLVFYSSLNHKEHFRSGVLAAAWTGSALYAAMVHDQQWIMPALVLNRRIFFDYALIFFRSRPRNKYEGNDWWVMNFFIPIFGRTGRLIELAIGLIITGASIFMLYKK